LGSHVFPNGTRPSAIAVVRNLCAAGITVRTHIPREQIIHYLFPREHIQCLAGSPPLALPVPERRGRLSASPLPARGFGTNACSSHWSLSTQPSSGLPHSTAEIVPRGSTASALGIHVTPPFMPAHTPHLPATPPLPVRFSLSIPRNCRQARSTRHRPLAGRIPNPRRARGGTRLKMTKAPSQFPERQSVRCH
jgi:hypothetical protein